MVLVGGLQSVYKKIPGLSRYLNLNKLNYNRDLLYMPFNQERQVDINLYESSYAFLNDPKLIKEHIQSIEMLGRGIHSLLWRNDRMGMMHSLEARFPFLDDNLIKFALNLPMHLKIGYTKKFYNYKHPFLMDKYIVRNSAEKLLPNELTQRKKDGFPLYGLMNLKIKNGFFKNGFLENVLEWSEKGRINFEKETDNYLKAKLACVEIWGRIFIIKENRDVIQKSINADLKINI